MTRLKSDQLVRYYIKQANQTPADIDLRTFVGRGQQGDGWFSSAWENIPKFLEPIFQQYIIPKVKSYLNENVVPNLKRGYSDVKSDVLIKRKNIKQALGTRGKETLKRIQHGRGAKKRRSKK